MVLTLALGIGANTAVFNLANWLLLRPVPGVGAPEELVTVGFGSDGARGPVAFLDVQALRAGVPALSSLAGYQAFELHVAATGGVPRRTNAEVVTGNYFDVLAGPVALGRGFTADEGVDPGLDAVAVVSHRLWQSAFGGTPEILGRTLTVNSEPFTVVGVAARGFHGASRSGDVDLWVPIAQHARAVPTYPAGVLTDRRVRMLFGLFGRLAPGHTLGAVADQAEAVRAGIAAAEPDDRRMSSWRFDVREGLDANPWMVERLNRTMALLMGIVSLLLLLTCANVANLMLARTSGRRGEIATRLALGASRFRVARLLLAESAVLSLVAGAAALGLAFAVGRLLEGTSILNGLPPLDRTQMDWRVFGFAVALSTLVAFLAGILPAIAGGRVSAGVTLREAGRSQTSGRRKLRLGLTTLQVAVSLILLIGAGLLSQSMVARLAVDPGFDAGRVLAFSVEPGLQGYGPRQESFYRDLLERAQQTPGVRAAGLSWIRPYSLSAADTVFRPEGADDDREVSANYNNVSPGYFDALGMPILEGRDFTAAEFQRPAALGDAPVILTESLARKVFGEGPVVGRRLEGRFVGSPTRTVVGVVADTRQRRLLDEEDIVFEAFGAPFPTGWATVLVGLSAPADAVIPALREIVTDLDANLPIYDVTTLDAAIRQQFADDILVMRLTLTFALLATLLAAVGLYGVMARSVAERQREIGIRAALGARPGAISMLVTKEAASVLCAGTLIGLPLSWWLSSFVESRLFGVERIDAASVGGALLFIAAATMLASWPSARRAARLDPAEVLRG
jgi:predicted permease